MRFFVVMNTENLHPEKFLTTSSIDDWICADYYIDISAGIIFENSHKWGNITS